ncbi:MAG: ABC transporter ATP-binding protein [Alphaproteobacteria bacterium]|nr:ABC transporter ATP-binding protein [Alphaproteobacteria bacterium]
MTRPALETQAITVSHGVVLALSDASFTARSREITAVIGANGAGKSSLLRAIIGLTSSTGDIFLQGENISRFSVEGRIRAGLAWVPEGRRVFPGMTVEENLLVAGSSIRIERRNAIEEVYTLFPQLADRPTDRAWQLSGGQQQMLSIGRAFMAKPQVFLLDEPSLGLAPRIADNVAASLRVLAKNGAAVVIAEQNIGFVKPIADQTVILRRGQLTKYD